MESFKLVLETIRHRSEPLFWFGVVCLAGACFCLLLSRLYPVQFTGVNAWYKPLKFCLSTVLFSWAMAWYIGYLKPGGMAWFHWLVIIGLGFEIVYIALQASRGQLSHFNQSTPFYALMFSLMALAATLVTLGTAYIGWLFYTQSFPQLPDHYVWGIRFGITVFVIFSFQGFAMGGNMGHTVGAADGGKGLPFLNWSMTHGDLRIAHFIGMHALQVLPVLAYYFLRNTRWVFVVAVLYALLAALTWWQALVARPLVR